MEQETLEEAAENYEKIHGGSYSIGVGKAFKFGAEWQQQNSYSEEEVLDILSKHTEYFAGFGERVSLTEWFNQFKKK
jgi:hypothetical protein